MSFVAVYLKRSQRIVIVKENFIQDLSNAKLKNNGRNSNQDFLVYWSANNNVANWGSEPDFNAPLSDVYEETTAGVCYIGRIIKFFGKKICLILFSNMIYLNQFDRFL